MAKHRVTVWMGTSAAILTAGLTACSAPSAPAVDTVSAAPQASAPAAAPMETASAAGESATPAAAAVQDAPAAQPASPAAPVTPAPAAPASAPAATPAASNGEFVEGPGKAVVQKACVSCHVAEQVTSQRRSKDQWADTVEKMISYGAPVSDAEFDTIVAYLTRHYGAGG